MFRNYFGLALCFVAILALTGCKSGEVPIGPGTTFDDPSAKAIMLPAPTDAQQVNQGSKPWCVPAAGLTLYRLVTGKDFPLEQLVTELKTNDKGTYISELVMWFNNHQMIASSVMIPTSGAVGMIAEEIRQGYYVLPQVNESAKPNSPHVFIVYGIDNGRVLISDSNTRLGMNRIGVEINSFRDRWLINFGTKDRPLAYLTLVHSKTATRSAPQKAGPAGAPRLPYEERLLR